MARIEEENGPFYYTSGTGRKEAHHANGDLYRALVENISDGIYTLDMEGKFTFVNAVIVKRSGYPREWFIGRSYLDVIRPEDRQRIEAIFHAVLQGEKKPPFETGYRGASGEIIWIETTGNPLWHNGEMAGFLCISRDVTDRKLAEDVLRETEKRYRSLFEGAGEGILVADSGTERFVYANPAICRMLGYTKEELTGMGVEDIHPEEDLEFVRAEFNALARGEKQIVYAIPCLGRDKKILYMDITVSRIEIGGMNCVGGFFIDITERKLAEEALRESEERYRGLIERLSEAVYRISVPEGRYEYMSQSAMDVFGYPSEAFLSTPIFIANFTHPDFAELWTGLMKGTIPPVCEYIIIDPRGEQRWILQSNSAIHNAEGTIVAIEGICRDITERKATEKALRESEERYRILSGFSRDLIFVIGPDDRIEYVNGAAASLVRKPSEEIVGRLRSTLFPPELARKQGRGLRHVLKTGEQFRTEGQMEVNGTMRWFDHLLVPIDDGYGRVSSVLGISRDITERKRAEDALALASRKLNLLSSITRHDILNQLTALRGYLEISRGVLFDPQALHDLLEKEVKVTETIRHQIIFTRDYQDMGVKTATWQNVHAAIDRAVATLPMRNIKVEKDRPDIEVFADPLLEKVFCNLIENALRYGGDRLTTIRFSSQESDSGLTIVCEDDGAGIADVDKKHLFERGFDRNSGLGLFLSREILGITEITITETSTGGSGARFEIAVPEEAYRFTGERETHAGVTAGSTSLNSK